jgi:hypothetical protein
MDRLLDFFLRAALSAFWAGMKMGAGEKIGVRRQGGDRRARLKPWKREWKPQPEGRELPVCRPEGRFVHQDQDVGRAI